MFNKGNHTYIKLPCFVLLLTYDWLNLGTEAIYLPEAEEADYNCPINSVRASSSYCIRLVFGL